MTDAQLLSDFIDQRSPDAFSALVKRHLPLVHATARRILGNSPLTDDVAQATFILLARKARAVNPLYLPGWLVNTARLAARQTLRNENTREKHESRAAQLRTTSSPQSQDPTIHHLTPLLDEALAKLTEIDRTAIILRFFNGLPFADVGRSLNISEEAARKRTRRALHKLRTRLLRHTPHLSIDALALTLAANQSPPLPDSLQINPLALPSNAPAATLAHQVLRTTFLSHLKLTAAFAAVLALLAFPVFLLSSPGTTVRVVAAAAPPPPPAAATAPAITPALTHIRAQIYLLRYSVITVATTDETYAVIRELVSLAKIDRSVVPELAAELDHVTGDSELRALAFTLRAINDPRAIPALIRALPKTPVLASDFGNAITNHTLWQFVTDHRLPNATPQIYPLISIPCANREISAALETMTDHTGNKAALAGARSDTPRDIARAQSLRQADADRWQNWWNEYAKELLTQQDLNSLTLLTTTNDPIETAGLATFGPLFPTGPGIHLGPTHDILLHPNVFFDQPAYINFASSRAFTLLENASHPENNLLTFAPWLEEMHIDASTCTSLLHPRPADDSDSYTSAEPEEFYGLTARAMRTWQINESRWGTIDAELSNPAPLDLDKWGLFGNFVPRDVHTGNPTPQDYPATFLFITSDHTRGILQLLESSKKPRGIHFRYRLIEGIPATEPTMPGVTQLNIPQLSRAFFTEKTITLASPATTDPSALDLDTGATRAADPSILNANHRLDTASTGRWLASWHADVIVEPLAPNPELITSPRLHNADKLHALFCTEMDIFPCTPAAYDKLSPADVTAIVNRRPITRNLNYVNFECYEESPATWAFKTREGSIGLLQITTAAPTSLTLRYKLLTP